MVKMDGIMYKTFIIKRRYIWVSTSAEKGNKKSLGLIYSNENLH